MSGPTWHRFKVVTHCDQGAFERELVRLSQDGWRLLGSGTETRLGDTYAVAGTHWAHLTKLDYYKRGAEEDRRKRGVLYDQRSYPADKAYGSTKPEKRSNPISNRRTATRRLDTATGKEDKPRQVLQKAAREAQAAIGGGPNS